MGIRSQGTNKERAEGLQALGKIGQGGGESGTGHKALDEARIGPAQRCEVPPTIPPVPPGSSVAVVEAKA